MEFALEGADKGYWQPITTCISELSEKYPQAQIARVYVGQPRRPDDLSMGYYDDKAQMIWFNAYWFSQPPEFLQAAAKAPPAFHGRMVEEPLHVCTHEFGHAWHYALATPEMDQRIREIWTALTKDPRRAVADYALVNPTECFAELFAAVELGLADRDQQRQLRYCVNGR
jgi:hypothetical protein